MHGHRNCLFRILNTRDYWGGGGQRLNKVCGPKEPLGAASGTPTLPLDVDIISMGYGFTSAPSEVCQSRHPSRLHLLR